GRRGARERVRRAGSGARARVLRGIDGADRHGLRPHRALHRAPVEPKREMGTRHEDQPTEHWAGPESLDPTPVWKQYLLVAALLVVGLVVVVIVAVTALAPSLATPPALVFGDRLVLSASDLPAVGAAPKLVGAPL